MFKWGKPGATRFHGVSPTFTFTHRALNHIHVHPLLFSSIYMFTHIAFTHIHVQPHACSPTIHVHQPYLSPTIFFTHHIFHPSYFSSTMFFTHHIFHPSYFSPTTFFTHHIFHPPHFFSYDYLRLKRILSIVFKSYLKAEDCIN